MSRVPLKRKSEANEYLKKMLDYYGLKTVDKRQEGGSLWVLGDRDINTYMEIFKQYGIRFDFLGNRSRETGFKDAWRLDSKDMAMTKFMQLKKDAQHYNIEIDWQPEKVVSMADLKLPPVKPTNTFQTTTATTATSPSLFEKASKLKAPVTVGIPSGSFLGFIEHICPEASMNAKNMENLIYVDPASAQVKGRTFAESIVSFFRMRPIHE
ncbi:MAG: hypothetical protein FWF59_02215 [Turicibacter sp.]|nr:hypothetical protein [Turicibacter sp.]